MPQDIDIVEQSLAERIRERCGKIVLVLQGGGALGAYQGGVYQALHEAGVEPDWVVGTSIGAINASLIAGNTPEQRVARLRSFWASVRQRPPFTAFAGFPQVAAGWKRLTAAMGIPGFSAPNPAAFLNPHAKLGAEAAGYYSLAPLAKTLSDLVDFDYLAGKQTRLTVGAAHVPSSEMRYFDSRDSVVTLKHILASSALPPLFPAVRIGGDLYWDGGILSNTPVETVLDDVPRRSSLVIAVHLWNAEGEEPQTLDDVSHRQTDLIYSSRTVSTIARQQQMHAMRQIIANLVRRLPEAERSDPKVKEMAWQGCLTQMHVVRLQAHEAADADASPFTDFSPDGIEARWQAGMEDTRRMLDAAPWEKPADPMLGFHLHDA
jgi:NTE family protein